MYNTHPCSKLNEIFTAKPYQGVAPEEATFLFIGLDANYHAEIGKHPIFLKIIEYHNDGVAFWQKYGVHHPFLLPEYSGDGKFYHRSFARIGFQPEHASLVSFGELLHVPTVGRNSLVASDLDMLHLKKLNIAILEGKPDYIFIPAGVGRLMKLTGVFPWLEKKATEKDGPLSLLYRQQNKTVYAHLHFSNYGKFEQRKVQELTFIGSLLLKQKLS
jgi:hypothetical protein